MKITFLLTQDFASPSGLGRYAPLARELSRLGHAVTVYALHPDFESLTQKSIIEENVAVEYVAPMHVRKKGSQKSYYSPPLLAWTVLHATAGLLRAALRKRPDLILVGKPHPMNGMAGALARAVWRCPLVLDCDDDEAGSGRFQYGWQRSVVNAFERFLPRRADWVTVNTMHTFLKMAALGVPESRIIYLPNGVDSRRFAGQVSKASIQQMRAELGLGDAPVISYIGSMSRSSHAVDLLVDAFHLLRQRDPRARLLLVGGGEDFDALRVQVDALGLAPWVTFTGRVTPEQAPLYYRLSDITVDPVQDNPAAMGRSPLKMFEAWACGVPFVTAPVGDRALLAGDPPAALLVAPGDARSLANGLYDLLGNALRREELSRLGSERVREYSWDRLVERMRCLLEPAR